MDGLTTNGVLVMHPAGEFVSEPAPGVWREISVCGNVFALRETRSAQQRGKLVRQSGVEGKMSQMLASIYVTGVDHKMQFMNQCARSDHLCARACRLLPTQM